MNLKLLRYLIAQLSSVQSVDPLGRQGEHERRFSRDSLPVFSAGGPCEQFWHGQECLLFDVVHRAFPLPTTASPNLQDALRDAFVEAVVACDMLELCELPSLGLLTSILQGCNSVIILTFTGSCFQCVIRHQTIQIYQMGH